MTSENTAAPALDADLMALATADTPPAAPAGAPAAAPAGQVGIDWTQEARELWQCVACLAIAFPSVEPIYTPEQIDRLAAVWAPVLKKHNFDMGKWMVYFAAGTATLPVAAATIKAIQFDREAKKAGAAAGA